MVAVVEVVVVVDVAMTVTSGMLIDNELVVLVSVVPDAKVVIVLVVVVGVEGMETSGTGPITPGEY